MTRISEGPSSPAALWHPFADMSAVAGNDFIIARGEGAYVTDARGRSYLDASAGLWYCNVGHGRPEIAEAAAAQMRVIASYSNFGDFATEPTVLLAERLSELSGLTDAKIFFTSGGSDAVDTAVKMVRRYWSLQGEPNRSIIITRERSYHGMHVAGTSMSGIPANREGYGDGEIAWGSEIRRVKWDDPADLGRVIDGLAAEAGGVHRVAAFFCEPVIGAGGVYPPPAGYLARVREICRERGVLFVADEVITGYGRTGAMFASHRWDIDPDLILTAKGLTSGYLPMGAVIVSAAVAEPFWQTPGLIWRHGYTYSGHATAAAVALANLDIIEGEQLVLRVAGLEPALKAALEPLRRHSFVADVRTIGLLGAVQIQAEIVAKNPKIGAALIGEIRNRGVLTRMLADGSLQVSPAFVVTGADLALLARSFDEALVAIGSSKVANEPRRLVVDLLPDTTRDEAGGFESSDRRLLADVPPHHGA